MSYGRRRQQYEIVFELIKSQLRRNLYSVMHIVYLCRDYIAKIRRPYNKVNDILLLS